MGIAALACANRYETCAHVVGVPEPVRLARATVGQVTKVYLYRYTFVIYIGTYLCQMWHVHGGQWQFAQVRAGMGTCASQDSVSTGLSLMGLLAEETTSP